MLLETVAAALLGMLVLWVVLAPLLRPEAAAAPPAYLDPLDPEETRRGVALIALKEIDFDRATGKLSDADYESLKAKYSAEALAAMRDEETGQGDPVEALIAERVRTLQGAPRFCHQCGTPLTAGSRFCTECGTGVAQPA